MEERPPPEPAGLPALRPMAPDRYQDFILAGEGGMGAVYQAFDRDLNRFVAVKVLKPPGPGGLGATAPPTPEGLAAPADTDPWSEPYEALRARFLQEAWITGALEHPGVVPIFELGQNPAGVPYYTMRYVAGERTLADALATAAERPFEERLALLEPFLKVCDTVAYAHAKGVIHRDLKPANVALGHYGEAVVLDWGLARVEGQPDTAASRWRGRLEALRAGGELNTLPGAIGSPGYMAPEAAAGRLEEIDRRSDVYSLGVMLYQILTGRLPHAAATFGEYVAALARDPAPPATTWAPAMPGDLSAICAQALSPGRFDRPSDAGALAERLRTWQAAHARERELAAHLATVRRALEAAGRGPPATRLGHLDEAAAAVAVARHAAPGRPEVRTLAAQVQARRVAALAEEERRGRRRVRWRAAGAVLGVAALAGLALHSAEREKARLDDLLRLRRLEEAALGFGFDLDRPWALGQETERWARAVAALEAEGLTVRLDVRRAAERFAGLARAIAAARVRYAEAWREVRAAIAAAPAYRGAQVAAQAGLVPLGPDPDSGLFEFAHVGSGALPARGADGTLVLAPDAAVVLVLIPGGTYLRGAQATDPGGANYDPRADPPEAPVHPVTISAPFFLAKHECTQAQWETITDGARPSFFGSGGRRPLEQVSWAEASAWLARVGLALPTEAQWEYACRAGRQTPFHVGSDPAALPTVAWYAANSRAPDDRMVIPGRTFDVGGLDPNAFGLHDMHGNVWEWCRDRFAPYAPGPQVDPVCELAPADRDAAPVAVRGGSWYESENSQRASARHGAPGVGYRCSLYGVRPARPLLR